MNFFLTLCCICLEVVPKQLQPSDSLKLVKESVSEYHCMTLPFVDDDTINMYNIDMAEQKGIFTYKYVIENDTDDYVVIWFGQEDFGVYMNRPLFPLSIMTIVYEYGSTLIMDSETPFSMPFVTFYKIVKPHGRFAVYIYDEDGSFSDELVDRSVRYICRRETFLVDNDYFDVMQNLCYQSDEIILNMKLFLKQPVWIKGKGFRLLHFQD